MHEQLVLKEAAEECAAGASLFLEKGEYAEGRIVFDYSSGREYAQEYLAYIKKNSKTLAKGNISWDMKFEDEKQGYSKTNVNKIPTVIMSIRVVTEDLFKVPFIEVTSLERSARYELLETEEKDFIMGGN